MVASVIIRSAFRNSGPPHHVLTSIRRFRTAPKCSNRTIAAVFRLRKTRPDAERPYRAFGYPVVPALYIAGALVILVVLFVYQGPSTWPGLFLVATGLPVYFLWKRRPAAS